MSTTGHESDIITVDGLKSSLQKFKNEQLDDIRSYSPSSYSGMGKVILKKNIKTIDGVEKNYLEASMINAANTVYVVKYDYTLSANITIPANCVLEFAGGSISGEYTLSGTGLKVIASDTPVFINCNCCCDYLNAKWFKTDDGENELYLALASLNAGGTLYLPEGEYIVNGITPINKTVNIIGSGYNSIITVNERTSIALQLYGNNSSVKNIYFRDTQDQTGFHNDPVWHQNVDVGIMILASNVLVSNCKFNNFRYGIWAGSDYYDTRQSNNTIENILFDLCEICICYRAQENFIVRNIQGAYVYFGTPGHIVYGTYSSAKEVSRSVNVVISNIISFPTPTGLTPDNIHPSTLKINGSDYVSINDVRAYGGNLLCVFESSNMTANNLINYKNQEDSSRCIDFNRRDGNDWVFGNIQLTNIYIEGVNANLSIKGYKNVYIKDITFKNTKETSVANFMTLRNQDGKYENLTFNSSYETDAILVDMIGGSNNSLSNVITDSNCTGRIAANSSLETVSINSDLIKNPSITAGTPLNTIVYNKGIKYEEIELNNQQSVVIYIDCSFSPKKITLGSDVRNVGFSYNNVYKTPYGSRLYKIESDHDFQIKTESAISSIAGGYCISDIKAGTHIFSVNYNDGNIIIKEVSIFVSTFDKFRVVNSGFPTSLLTEDSILYEQDKKRFVLYNATLGEKRYLNGGSMASFVNSSRPTNVEQGFLAINNGTLEVYRGYWVTVKTDIYARVSGTTAQRPSSPSVGFCYYDTTLNKPVWHKGSDVWIDAAGATV